LFLDEPTSGLDAFTALNIIKTIKDLAISQKKIILMTIHQPRTDILDMIDKVFLLSMGKCVFFGPNQGTKLLKSDALDHFAKLSFEIPPNINASDFYLDITTFDQRSDELRKETKARIEMFVTEFEKKAQWMDETTKVSTKPPGKIHTQWPTSGLNEFLVLWDRYSKDSIRDKAFIGSTFGQNIFMLVNILIFNILRS
jgi:ABC-type multidrug transport system ATPase subunit